METKKTTDAIEAHCYVRQPGSKGNIGAKVVADKPSREAPFCGSKG